MKNLLEFLLIHLVNHPEDVVVEETQLDTHIEYTLHVHQEDMGRIIGKQGSVIDAIRKIARVRAMKEGTRISVNVAEATVGTQPTESESYTTASDEVTSDETVSEELTADSIVAGQ
jgi:predicted RNA-binding protein YlqC (UPF0109 family)